MSVRCRYDVGIPVAVSVSGIEGRPIDGFNGIYSPVTPFSSSGFHLQHTVYSKRGIVKIGDKWLMKMRANLKTPKCAVWAFGAPGCGPETAQSGSWSMSSVDGKWHVVPNVNVRAAADEDVQETIRVRDADAAVADPPSDEPPSDAPAGTCVRSELLISYD